MKVLMINGSPRNEGNTTIALEEMRKVFEKNSVEVEIIQIGQMAIHGCISCNYCYKNGKCAFNDIVNQLNEKFEKPNGLVVLLLCTMLQQMEL